MNRKESLGSCKDYLKVCLLLLPNGPVTTRFLPEDVSKLNNACGAGLRLAKTTNFSVVSTRFSTSLSVRRVGLREFSVFHHAIFEGANQT